MTRQRFTFSALQYCMRHVALSVPVVRGAFQPRARVNMLCYHQVGPRFHWVQPSRTHVTHTAATRSSASAQLELDD